MTKIVTAIYENGILRPLQPLPLQERQRVRIQVLSEDDSALPEDAIRQLVERGLLTPPAGHSALPVASVEERRALADKLARSTKKPPSEVIIEERGEW
ncbi:MAG: DUF104 domain-containing protein [Caldilineae bacterium]|nr:MAG: DUF104 domain-containing protein [Caldilineae bacterium]